ncbi:MAG: sugar ABC transporter ATP-binding protein [Hyphomicrobiales bacterium]|nr:sugar ABC transporter ATP-binding protein [Hyphomicrobiales bacterium]MCP4998918.1 sugar ABC transporter ATP-binding protein [Hyphomicrobiales bacterium]
MAIDQASAGDAPCISLRGIGKSFGGVPVLSDIDLDIGLGEIHGLVGENGAGKSTLGKIIGGYYSASVGHIEVFGDPVSVWTPPLALDRGVAMMHQELQLVPALSVAQNVFLGIEEQHFGVLAQTENARLADVMTASGFSLDPAAITSDLSIADQQKIEIMRALAREARVIVMDEPTSSLTADEAERLHETMLRLKQTGATIIYVSHFLDDILAVCDRITVLRDGRLVRTADAADETKGSLVSAMLGGEQTETPYPPKSIPQPSTGEPALLVENLSAPSGVSNVSLTVNGGEIVGLIGLVGSGRTEIARAIFGADRANGGTIRLSGKPYDDRTPAVSAERGIVMVPEDRRKQGLVMTLPVRANMTLPHLSHFTMIGGTIRTALEKSRVRELIDYFRVMPANVDGEVPYYSGGNQQKVLLGKWLMRDPGIVILDEPSRGVDVGARQRIHEAISELAAKGTAVLLISSEIEEVLGLAHRAYLVHKGGLVGEVDPETSTTQDVLWALFHQEDNNSEALGGNAP